MEVQDMEDCHFTYIIRIEGVDLHLPERMFRPSLLSSFEAPVTILVTDV